MLEKSSRIFRAFVLNWVCARCINNLLVEWCAFIGFHLTLSPDMLTFQSYGRVHVFSGVYLWVCILVKWSELRKEVRYW